MTGRQCQDIAKGGSTGEIGPTKIIASPRGQICEIIHTELPEDKEELEDFFARRFVAQFNANRPLGAVEIADLKQNDTSDPDFSIKSMIADYLELAELNPRSEPFGRSAYRDGRLNIYEYARWIYLRVIKRKTRAYGITADRTVLLLYVTHWQFFPSERVIECLHSLIQQNGCVFAAVFILLTNGTDLRILSLIHPFSGPRLPAPSSYRNFTLTNCPPGRSSWTIPT